MFTYKDMTFCINDKCKKTCSRKLTEQITESAKKIGMPLAVSNYICVDCGDDEDAEEVS